jgi:hypothetical protein
MMRIFLLFLALAASASAIEKRGENEPATLLTIKRVFVDRFGGGETATQMRDMIINSLQSAKLFVITENEERADVVLRGSAEDLVFNDDHSLNDNINLHANMGSSSRSFYGTSSSSSNGIGASQNESSKISERKHEASASIRLVNGDGDVIWAATKESLGGKFRGSSADVADKILKQLIQDIASARASASKQAGTPSK